MAALEFINRIGSRFFRAALSVKVPGKVTFAVCRRNDSERHTILPEG
jgi:hypothetical protein